MRLAIAIALITLLAACGRDRDEVKPDLPTHCPSGSASEVRIVERKVYVAIPPTLTRREDIAEGTLAECPQVARDRRAAIERLNSRMQQIEAQQGTEVKP